MAHDWRLAATGSRLAAASVLGVHGRRRKDDTAAAKIENGKFRKAVGLLYFLEGVFFEDG